MRTSYSRFACVALLLVLGVSAGFGWGTLTHVYFANNLGVSSDPFNKDEIYGAVLPDLFGVDFTNQGFMADYLFHTNADVYWGFYGSAPNVNTQATFYGVFTHSNINNAARGADWYAHGIYPMPGEAPHKNGWVIQQGRILVKNPSISAYINDLLGPYSDVFLSVVGHTLIETAVDILVKRNEYPLAGENLILAAQFRSDGVPEVLAGVFGNIPGCPAEQDVLVAEETYRVNMMGYGQLFLLPELQLIAALSQQTIDVAQIFLHEVLEIPEDQLPAFEADKIAGFIQLAIDQVAPIYQKELLATLRNVEHNMKFGPPPAGSTFAKNGAAEDELAEFNIPAEAPTDFALNQNYPNPFNPTTSIAYAVPADGRFTLKVYNSLGQEVATLVDDNMTAGRYVARWDANGIAGGTYFYRMQAGNTVLTKKMVLLK